MVAPKRSLEELIEKAQRQGYPPSLKILVSHNSKTIVDHFWGKPARYFDVASVTKIMATTPLCMSLFQEGRLKLNEKVSVYLPYFKNSSVGDILIKNLLCHHSGLVAWRPFYKKLWQTSPECRVDALKKIFKKERVKRLSRCIYSDLDFILLGWIVEGLYDCALDEAAELRIFRPLSMENTLFNPKKYKSTVKDFAPTEKTAKRGLVKGFVFDDNAESMGGVSGHAGLFSTGQDVQNFGRHLLQIYRGKKGLWSKKTLKHFTNRAVPSRVGDWGLGFTLPSKPVSTAGTLVSQNAFGHVGYTGTSLWIDPKHDAVVTILSNRTFPNRNDERFRQLRRDIHDCIWEILDG